MTSSGHIPGEPLDQSARPIPQADQLAPGRRVPREVRWAALALWVIAVLYAINGLLALATRDARADVIRERRTYLTDAEIDRAVTLSIIIGLVFAMVIAALAVVSALNAPRGRGWARTTATVVSALAVAFGLLGLRGGGAATLANLVVVVAGISAMILLYRRPAGAFFAAAKRT